MPKVYILNKGSHNYTDAKRFGELVFVTEGSIPLYDFSYVENKVKEALYDSGPEDFIVIASLNSLCAIASSMFATRWGHVNFLLFRKDKYEQITIQTKGVLEDDRQTTKTSSVPAGSSSE